MPSWGIHLEIANRVYKKLGNIDKNLFMFGNVMPDINNGYVIKDVNKIISHKITHYDGEKDFKGYKRFYIKYAKYMQNPIFLGSLTHLMADYYYNNITYTKKAIWDKERKNVIGVKLADDAQLKCDKEKVRKMKVHDFRIFADFSYKNSNFEKLLYDSKMMFSNGIIKEFEITDIDAKNTIEYLNSYIENQKSIIDENDKKEYIIFSQDEMEKIANECVEFILKFLDKIQKIKLGKTAGFCYGVKRAIEGAENEIKQNMSKDIYCLGEIVHNKQVVENLEKQGIKFIEEISEAKDMAIIRAHGIPKEVEEEAKKRKIMLKDYTCPNVLKIHEIADEYAKNGYFVFLCGSKKHPENIGTISHCKDNSCIIENESEVINALEAIKKTNVKKLLVISQTTYSLEKFNIIEEIIKNELPKDVELVIRNTICKATEIRQKETEEMAKDVDCMIVIGGKNSSNTKKLYEIAKSNCSKAILIENYKELEIEKIPDDARVGIMAGASTPQESIENVIEKIIKQF